MCCNLSDTFLYKIDFNGSTTSYSNKIMRGLKYRLLRDADVLMKPDIDYSDKVSGGFDLLSFEMKEDTCIVIQFY